LINEKIGGLILRRKNIEPVRLEISVRKYEQHGRVETFKKLLIASLNKDYMPEVLGMILMEYLDQL